MVLKRKKSGNPRSTGKVVIVVGIREAFSTLIPAVREDLMQRGLEVRLEHDEKLAHSKSSRLHRSLMQRWPDALWVLSGVSEACQRDFERSSLQTMILGTAHPGISIPCVDWDYAAVAFHAVGTLAARRYRRLVLVPPRQAAAGDASTERNIMQQADRRGMGVRRLAYGATPKFARSLIDACRAESTAIFAFRAESAVSIYLTLLKNGVRVPDTAGLLLRSSDPFLDAIDHPISHYATHPVSLAHRAAKIADALLSGTGSPRTASLLIPEFIEGETLLKPIPAGSAESGA